MTLATFLLILSPLFSQALTVAVDAGHGGIDHGATLGKVRESEVVLGVSQQLTALINQDPQFHAFLTREDDHGMELHQRVRVAKKNNTQLFISIHANSSPDPKSQGMELYFRNELEPDQESLRLASQENQEAETEEFALKKNKRAGDLQSILQDLKRSANSLKSYELSWHILRHWNVPFSKARNQAIKQGPFHVINQQDYPSVLVEIGFVTNDKEAKRLMSADYQKEIARSIYAGLKDFKETLDKDQSKALK
jgi:N-acetylmuramoyl-L-alanine amidase